MNRHQRRRSEAMARALGDKTAISKARQDGRPQYYDIMPGDRAQCYICLRDLKQTAQYGRGEAFIADPGNSPEDDGGVYTLCFGHLPDDAVIHDPVENLTRAKSDPDSPWREPDATTGKMPPKFEEPKHDS